MGDDCEVCFLLERDKGSEHKRHKREDTKSTRHAGQGWHAVAYHPVAYASLLFLNEELRNSGKTPNPSGFPEFLIINRLSHTHLPLWPLFPPVQTPPSAFSRSQLPHPCH
jgi:hypothetical protein